MSDSELYGSYGESTTQIGAVKKFRKSKFYKNSVDYVNGGVVITYPIDFFDSTPIVNITIELRNLVYNTSRVIAPIITSNNQNSTTVSVNIYQAGLVTEAATNDITLHVYATN